MALERTHYNRRKNFQGFAHGKPQWAVGKRRAAKFLPNPNAANGEGDLHYEGEGLDGQMKKLPKLRLRLALQRAQKTGKQPKWKGMLSPAQEWLQQQQLGGTK